MIQNDARIPKDPMIVSSREHGVVTVPSRPTAWRMTVCTGVVRVALCLTETGRARIGVILARQTPAPGARRARYGCQLNPTEKVRPEK